MFVNIFAWKAPWIRTFLIAGAFLLLLPKLEAQYFFNENCRSAYSSIISLRFSEASGLISLEKKQRSQNLVPVYLENFRDFLSLVISEERPLYQQLKELRGVKLSALEHGSPDSPYHLFCLGEFHLQWGIARLKFGDYTAAALEIRKAYGALADNEKLYPAFMPNKMALGIIHVLVSLIPENYRWVSNLMGLNGSMEHGLNEIRQVANYSGEDEVTRLFRQQAAFYLAFLDVNLRSDKKEALANLPYLALDKRHDKSVESPLLIYARASILMKNGRNDEALHVLQERGSCTQTFPFYFLDYLDGMARLNALDFTASGYFEKYVNNFKGRSYLSAAYQKLAWIALMKEDSAGYARFMRKAGAELSSSVDEDQQALRESRTNNPPNVILLRARLLCDGGYYNLALKELLDNSVSSAVKSKRDLVEYTYRLGRIYHESGNLEKAEEYYHRTIGRGRYEPYYYAAGAAYQLGLLQENKRAYAQAENAYRLCLTIDTPEYKTSLHQKAKAGLKRLSKVHPKT